MALKTTVKVTVNNLSDARYCAGMGVDFIGFSVDPEDPYYQSPESFKEISEWLSGVYFIAEAPQNADLTGYDIDLIQISNPAEAALFEKKNVVLEGTLEDMISWKKQLNDIPNLSMLLINIDNDKDTYKESLQEFQDYKVLCGYDLDISEVNALASQDIGIALKGSDEIKPGLKDYDELADILESLEVDEPY